MDRVECLVDRGESVDLATVAIYELLPSLISNPFALQMHRIDILLATQAPPPRHKLQGIVEV